MTFAAITLRSLQQDPLTYTQLDQNQHNLQHATVPIGGMIFWMDPDLIPPTWLICNGAAVSKTLYSSLYDAIGDHWGDTGDSNTFALPDLRAAFVRGIDASRGEDPDRVWGSFQDSANKEHTHTFTSRNRTVASAGTAPVSDLWGSSGSPEGTTTTTTSTSGDAVESRPRNYPVIYLIKAFDPETL